MLRCLPSGSPAREVARWFRAGAMLVVVAAPTASPAQAQLDRTTVDRLDRIERDLNMLERQVYRGAPAAAPAPGQGVGATGSADVEIRMERLEAQMRDLTGKVEEIANGLDQLRQRVEQINSDIDVRLGQTGGASVAVPPPAARPLADASRFPPPLASGAPGMPPGTAVPPPSGGGGLNPIFSTLSPPGTGPARQLPPPVTESSAAAEPPGGSVNEQFNHAFGLLKQSDYGGAEAAFRAFIEAHPNDALAGNAQYWLGQTYYARNRFQDAAAAFADGYRRFPKGPKAPDVLLYLGMSLAKADQKKNACLALEQLDQSFPNAAPAIRQRAGAEKKRLGCG